MIVYQTAGPIHLLQVSKQGKIMNVKRELAILLQRRTILYKSGQSDTKQEELVNYIANLEG